MPYRFLPDVAIADIAIEITAKSLDELLRDAALALEEQTVNVSTLSARIKKDISVAAKDPESLLYDFLSELIFLKDTDQFLFKTADVKVKEKDGTYEAEVALIGDTIKPEKQELRNDIKAVTMHMFSVEKTGKGWKATVVVDI